jgi:isoquinoline 1-oxidoreductase subunit beta
MNIITSPDKLRGIEGRIKVENVSRRSILKGLGIAGGLVLAAPVMSRQAFAAYQTGADKMPHGTVVDPRVFVAIASDGTVTIVAHRSEMGTGVRTSLPLIVAEEMEADWSRVKVAQAHGDEVKFGNQDTDGSRSTRHYLIPMREIGASARTMLEAAAAKRWGVYRRPRSRPSTTRWFIPQAAAISGSASWLPMPRRNRCQPWKA